MSDEAVVSPRRVWRDVVECAECGGRREVELDTDGMGEVVEVLAPCRGCVARRNEELLVRRYLLVGMGAGQVADRLGRSRQWVLARLDRLERSRGSLSCACGRPIRHLGRCGPRRRWSKSPTPSPPFRPSGSDISGG